MKIALIGAGSSVGRYLLANGDADYIGIYRSERALSQLCDLHIGHQLVKVTDPSNLATALGECDAVVTLINDTNPHGALKSLIQVFEACVSAGIPQLIHVSSAAIYGPNAKQTQVLEKAGPVLTWNSYAVGKQLQENYLKRNRERLPSIMIIRPGLIWGPGMAWLHAPAGEVLRREAWIAEGDAPCNLVNIRFLAHAIQYLIINPPRKLSFCNIYDRERLTWGEYYQRIAQNLGIDDCKLHIVPRSFVPPWIEMPSAIRYLFPLGLVWSVSPDPLKKMIKNMVQKIPRLQTSVKISLEPLDTPHLTINRELWELKTAKGMPPTCDMLEDLYRSYPGSDDKHWAEVTELRKWIWV